MPPSENEEPTRCAKCLTWLRSPSFAIYTTYLISQWGDWMWIFASGLYLVHLDNGMLRLAGTFGFASGGCIMLFGGLVGDWVDRNRRLTVLRISLGVLNSFIMLCAATVCVALYLEENRAEVWGGWLKTAFEVGIVTFAIVAQLANIMYKIMLERDWMVVVSRGDKSMLANLNAVVRGVDLSACIISPLCVGAVMTYISLMMSALGLTFWYILAFIAEYCLLMRVYRLVPELAKKKLRHADVDGTEMEVTEPMTKSTENGVKDETVQQSSPKKSRSCLLTMFDPIIVLVKGWRIYIKQTVVFAGVALGLLYMTVMGFDSCTVGYIYGNGIAESEVGIIMALGGVTGILATFIYPSMRRRFGLKKTGIIAFSWEIICLILAVISIWLPGTTFDMDFADKPDVQRVNCTSTNLTVTTVEPEIISNTSEAYLTPKDLTENDLLQKSCDQHEGPNTSIIVFLIGIIASRTGLWLADLVVTQLLQENVIETERGVVNGVQNSINMLLEMIKFILVMILPHVQTFGILIILSFVFICIAGGLFCFYALRESNSKTESNPERIKSTDADSV